MAEAANDLAFYGALQKALFIKRLTVQQAHAANFGPPALADALTQRIATEQGKLARLTKLLPKRLAEAIRNT